MRSIPQMSNSFAVLSLLIKDLKVPVTRFTIRENLEEHPDFPSLLAISDCLTTWNIPHETYRVNKETYNPEELNFPFIAHSSFNGGTFSMIKEIKNKTVKFLSHSKSITEISEDEFLKNWDGIVLYAEKAEESGEQGYNKNLLKGMFNQLRVPFLVLTLLFTIAGVLINYSIYDVAFFSLLGIKATGILLSTLLLSYSINANNPFLQNLCGLGSKNNCNAILKSNAAQVNSWLSWTEVGLFYFSGSFICLLLFPEMAYLLAWLSIACLPYTFYSIGYQLKKRNWCVLCCTVQGLLWLEAIAFTTSFRFKFDTAALDPLLIFYLLTCFLMPIAIWSFIKPYLLKSEQVNPLKKQLKKFKYNSEIFNQLLTQQTQYTITDDLMPIQLGNPNAETVITLVSNPFCGPCSGAHKTLDKWLQNRNDIQMKILFATANHDDDIRTKVARHMTALSLLEDKKIVKNALNDWYEQTYKSYEQWAFQYPVALNNNMYAVTEKQKTWCVNAQITATPTILINGYKLVEPYQLNDIEYLLS